MFAFNPPQCFINMKENVAQLNHFADDCVYLTK